MAEPRSPLGSTGDTVRTNVKRLREADNLTFAGLARRLQDVGRPIPTLGLRRLEAGERRVDADDLVALALAFGVSPATLLMPTATDGDERVTITGMEATAQVTWKWLVAVGPPAPTYIDPEPDVGVFRRQARPRWELSKMAPLHTGEDLLQARLEEQSRLFKQLTDAGVLTKNPSQEAPHGDS